MPIQLVFNTEAQRNRDSQREGAEKLKSSVFLCDLSASVLKIGKREEGRGKREEGIGKSRASLP